MQTACANKQFRIHEFPPTASNKSVDQGICFHILSWSNTSYCTEMCFTIAGKTKCSPWFCVENSFTLLCRENAANDECNLSRLEKQLPRQTSTSISVIFINCYEFSQWPFCTISWQNHSAGLSMLHVCPVFPPSLCIRFNPVSIFTLFVTVLLKG